jgi:hypothetical protein
LGKLVGQGGFSVVKEILSIDLDDVYDTGEAETKCRKTFCRQLNSGATKNKYVLKMLRTDLPVEEHVKGTFFIY